MVYKEIMTLRVVYSSPAPAMEVKQRRGQILKNHYAMKHKRHLNPFALLAMALAVGLFYLFASSDSCDSDSNYYFSAPADKNYAVCEQNYDYSVFQSFAICENMPKTFDINDILS